MYLGTLANGFVYDDPLAVEHARRPLLELLPHRYGLTLASIHLDHRLWSTWAPGFHLTNVLLHAVASALAVLLALSLGAGRATALWCGLLFAVHPVHVEAVTSIENRKEILAMIFAAASLIWHRRGGRGGRGLAAGATIVAFALAMSAKDVAVVALVVLLPLVDRLLGPGDGERAGARRRALAVLLVGAVLTAWYARDAFGEAGYVARSTTVFASRAQALATSVAAVPELARLLAVPNRLAADHPKNLRPGLDDPQALAGMALVAAWLVAAALAARRAPLVAVAMAWPVVMYAPLANVVATLTPYPVAERYLYVPSFGCCLLVALAIGALLRPSAGRVAWWSGVALGVLLVAAGAARSAMRVPDWRDGLSLWTSALRAFPEGSTRIHAELGMALLAAGRSAEAVPHLERALALGPPEATFYNNLGLALWQAGRRPEAIGPFQQAVALWPGHQMMRFNLGSALLQLGRVDEARPHLALLADPAAWQTMDRSVLVALQAQGATPETLRASLRAWLDRTPAR